MKRISMQQTKPSTIRRSGFLLENATFSNPRMGHRGVVIYEPFWGGRFGLYRRIAWRMNVCVTDFALKDGQEARACWPNVTLTG